MGVWDWDIALEKCDNIERFTIWNPQQSLAWPCEHILHFNGRYTRKQNCREKYSMKIRRRHELLRPRLSFSRSRTTMVLFSCTNLVDCTYWVWHCLSRSLPDSLRASPVVDGDISSGFSPVFSPSLWLDWKSIFSLNDNTQAAHSV